MKLSILLYRSLLKKLKSEMSEQQPEIFTLLEDIENFFEPEDVKLNYAGEPITNDEEHPFRTGSTSLKIIGKKVARYNKNLIINTDNKEYNDYKTTKKIKDTLRRILNDTTIECNKTEIIIDETTELFKSLKTVSRSRNRLAGLAICYYKTASSMHTPIKATQLIPIFKCHKRDLANFIRKNDWNLSDNEYDFIIKYGHILGVSEHTEDAKNILKVCINNVRNLKGPSSSKISTMSAAVWLYVLSTKDSKYTVGYISLKLDVGKASISKYYKYIMINEATITTLALSINGTNSDNLTALNAN